MKSKNETTALEPTKVVGGAGKKETSHFAITTVAARERISRQLTRERVDAFRFAMDFANSMSFWRKRGEYKMAGHAVLHHLHLALTG